MDNFTILNYQGSKNNLSSFIYENLEPYIQDGKAIFDIFSGSAAVSNIFRDEHQIYANDVEPYASIIADAILNQADIEAPAQMLEQIEAEYLSAGKTLAKPILPFITQEQSAIQRDDFEALAALYQSYPTVWNHKYSEITGQALTVDSIRAQGDYYLFTTYYATNYYGIGQALEIDCLIKVIHTKFKAYKNALLACLFYAMKEAVFAKDGHMAQPLNLEKNQNRLLMQRTKDIYQLFVKKYQEYIALPLARYAGQNRIFNSDFEALLDAELFSNVGLVYADPPYTDMQYSRYYHLLNVASQYDYPALTTSKSGYTKGLYTEGRYQSKLSQHSSAKGALEKLIQFCAGAQTNLAISYGYPEDPEKQATDRYTISIDELVQLAEKYFTPGRVQVVKKPYSHANHRNSAQKKVVEYLVLCGERNITRTNVSTLKSRLSQTAPSKNNAMYNSHLYWSQKSYNVCDILIQTLSNRGDVVFDPFLGSGVTCLEAVRDDMLRRAIGCDINDMPIFISKTLLSVRHMDGLRSSLEHFLQELEPLKQYYQTTCPVCGQAGIISKVVFDKPERTGNGVEIRTIYYSCPCIQRGNKAADADDYARMQTVTGLRNVKDTSLLANSKLAVAENDDIKNIFTGRNLSVLDEILTIIRQYDPQVQNVLNYILMSILHLCKITDKHSNSQWPLWIPRKGCVEKNVVELLWKKTRKFMEVIPFMEERYSGAELVDSYAALQPGGYLLMKKGSQNISQAEIPDNGVDLIITDPPYLEQVPYSEYMQLYKPFLALNYNLEDEIVVSSAPSRDKGKDTYFELLEQVFCMCARKLKLHHYLCLYFHDCNLTVWNRLIAILERNCFRFITQIHIDKSNTLKNIISPKKSLNGDSILIFTRATEPIVHRATEDIDEIEHNIIRQSRFMVRAKGALSTPELYDNGLMEILIQNGWLSKLSQKYSSLVDIFERHLNWDFSIGKWTIQQAEGFL